jgi:hypothetical protein
VGAGEQTVRGAMAESDDRAAAVQRQGPRCPFLEDPVVIVSLGGDPSPGLAHGGEHGAQKLPVGADDGGAGVEGSDQPAQIFCLELRLRLSDNIKNNGLGYS